MIPWSSTAVLSACLLFAPPPAPAPPSPPPVRDDDSVFVSVSMGRARLGITATSMTKELRGFFGAQKDVGILVSRVHDDAPADKGGLKVGDVVVAVDGDRVADVGDVHEALADRDAGDRVEVIVVRNKKRVRKTVELTDDASDVMFGSGGFSPPSWSFGAGEIDIDSEHLQRRIERELRRARRELERLERRLQQLEQRKDKKKEKGRRSRAPKSSV